MRCGNEARIVAPRAVETPNMSYSAGALALTPSLIRSWWPWTLGMLIFWAPLVFGTVQCSRKRGGILCAMLG